MSRIEIRQNRDCARFEISGHITERDLCFDPSEAVLAAKRQLIGAIVDRLMERLGPRLDKAIEEAFSN